MLHKNLTLRRTIGASLVPAAAAVFALGVVPAFASPQGGPPPNVVFAAPFTFNGLADGVPVKVILKTDLKSGVAKEGDQVPFAVKDAVLDANGHVVIPAGTPALGHVVQSSHRGFLGKPGKLEFTCDYVALPDNTRVPLRAREKTKYGVDNRAIDVAAAVLISPVALLIKGRDVTASNGQEFTMYVNQEALESGAANGRCSFLLNNGTTVIGRIGHFDGATYLVHTDQGDRSIRATDIKVVSPAH